MIVALLLSATLEVPSVAESQLLGTWVSVQRSTGGLGTVITFKPGGTFDQSTGAIMETWYRMKGDTIEGPGPTTNSKPVAARLRFEGDTFQRVGDPVRYVRVGKAQRRAPRIVGVWRAESAAAILPNQTVEYTRDGLIKFRAPMITTPGTYDLKNQTITFMGRNASFRIDNGLLILTQPDTKNEERYIRADASKEQMKRAGIRYGDKPAELEPPSH